MIGPLLRSVPLVRFVLVVHICHTLNVNSLPALGLVMKSAQRITDRIAVGADAITASRIPA